jgi:sphingomyelin phosphodiesterase
MLSAIADVNPAFSIYTGDVAAHDYWLVNKNEVLHNFNSTYGPIEKNLGRVYAALGNHDTSPAFQFPSDNVPSQYSPQWAYQALAKDWFALTGIPSVKTASEHGSYSAIHPNSKLRIISYNSIFYYKNNFFAYTEPIEFDPDDQLHWLINELQEAEDNKERVWLISHIPTGDLDHFRDHSHYFDQIIQRYEATIAALFFGHTHKDEFQISYSDYANRNWDTATAIGYIAPSLTPTSGSPSFRVYQIDPVTFGVIDFTQYIANISDSSYQREPEWKPYYSAKANYGSKLSPVVDDASAELTPAFWHNVTVAMENDHSIFRDFWSKRVRGFNVSECTGGCISNELCALRGADLQYSCHTSTSESGFFTKRDGFGTAIISQEVFHEPECDHSEAASLFDKMAHRARLGRGI